VSDATAGGSLRVALTFDAEHPDRPSAPPGNAERILDTLARFDARATFFVQGRWAESQPDTARRIADDGHLVGHHSHYHARMPLLLGGGLEWDIAQGETVIERHTGRDPHPWFRCPFGDGHDDPRVLSSLDALGYRNVHWDVELEDWEPWRTGAAIAADGIDGVAARGDGAVVLLHTWPGGTADAIEPLVTGLLERGASFVTVGDLEVLP
jgi:peptidoglycan/xylan/chitin deacetylase (PgdA/CDA1 family)